MGSEGHCRGLQVKHWHWKQSRREQRFQDAVLQLIQAHRDSSIHERAFLKSIRAFQTLERRTNSKEEKTKKYNRSLQRKMRIYFVVLLAVSRHNVHEDSQNQI